MKFRHELERLQKELDNANKIVDENKKTLTNNQQVSLFSGSFIHCEFKSNLIISLLKVIAWLNKEANEKQKQMSTAYSNNINSLGTA
jgi:hypothetical protein